VAGLLLYSPAFDGDFVFDDFGLPFQHSTRVEPLSAWLSGVRPVLMFSYWLNDRVWGPDPLSYHILNFLIHVASTGLVFLVLHRLLELAGWAARSRVIGAVLGAVVFLIHPLETESVSYIAGRSESLSALFVLLAYSVFLYRAKEAISWKEAIAVSALFGVAVGAKENAVSLAGVLILTDLYWPVPFSFRSLRANWRLYALLAPGALVGAALVLRMLMSAPTAGFSLRSFTWYQYFFTEARAVFTYLRLAVLPYGQSVDHDFAPSRTILEHGAIFYIAALALLVALAIRMRRRYPLSCFGLLLFLVLLAPTSSVVPIADALVERRMYLPLAGLILIGCEWASRIRPARRTAAWAVFAGVLLLLGELCYERNRLWSRPEDLMAAATVQATRSSRPLAQLTDQLIARNRCDAAAPYLEDASRRFPSDYWVELSWGRILECVGRREEAMGRLQRAAAILPTSKVYELIGLLHGEMSQAEEAGAALRTAIELDPNSVSAHKAMALWYESIGNLASAEQEYRTVLGLDRNDGNARFALDQIRRRPSAP
jgi:tetratricopeptide (TPR) repeat protein